MFLSFTPFEPLRNAIMNSIFKVLLQRLVTLTGNLLPN